MSVLARDISYRISYRAKRVTTPFPGMDPYLERRSLWEEVYVQLITALARELNPLLRPQYRVAVEKRTYLTVTGGSEPAGKPDVLVLAGDKSSRSQEHRSAPTQAVNGSPLIVELPIPEQIVERYLEVRDVATNEVITTVEILPRVNKSDKAGRNAYTKKRHQVLRSQTHLVEIDLLRAGEPVEINLTREEHKDYHILISRSHQRPCAEVYACTLREPLPLFSLPLRTGEVEPVVDLTRILHELYEILNFDLAVDYTQDADPPVPEEEAKWVDQLLREHNLRP